MVCTLCPVPSNTLTSYVYARQLYRDAAGLAHQPMRRSLPVELRKGILCAAQPNKQQLDVKVKAAADDILTPVATQLGDIHTATSQLLHAHQEVSCTLSGLDSVQCVITEEPDEVLPAGADGAQVRPQGSTSTENAGLGPVSSALLLISPFFFWGTSMCAMKGVLPHTTPLLMGALRLLPAGVALVAWAAVSGRQHPRTATAWGWVAAFALIDAAAFQGFLAEGLQRTSAGLGSVIIDSQPLTVAVLAALLFGESLGGVAVVGLALGVAGLGLLNVPEDVLLSWLESFTSGSLTSAGSSLEAATASSTMDVALSSASSSSSSGGLFDGLSHLTDSGEFWMLLAAQSMAVGTIMVRYVSKHVDPVMATGWHMVLGGAVLAAAAVSSDGPVELSSRLAMFTGSDVLAMLYVSLLGGAAGYGIYFYNATHGSLTSLSSLTFLTPVFASATGFLAMGETMTPLQLAGGAVTLVSVGLINKKPTDSQPQVAATPLASNKADGQ